MRRLGADPLLDGLGDLSGAGETAALLLGEDQLVADRDLEDASVASDEFGFDAELLLELVRQTGGTWVVVSACAVFNGNVGDRHDTSSFRGDYRARSAPTLGRGGARRSLAVPRNNGGNEMDWRRC
jgi:hypothetical protein